MMQSKLLLQYNMPNFESFLKQKREFKKNYEGLKINPNLITIDGPDGVGKTTITEKVVENLKNKFEKEGKNSNDVIYFKYTSLIDTDSQKTITKLVKESVDENGVWDKTKMEHLTNLFSARLNRSYGDNIIPLLDAGKTVIMDRSEVDVIRAWLEWGNGKGEQKVIDLIKDGTLTHGISAGTRIFISGDPKEIWDNLSKRGGVLTENDPRSLEDVENRVKKYSEAEQLTMSMYDKELPNVINIQNNRLENIDDREKELNRIAEEITNQIK